MTETSTRERADAPFTDLTYRALVELAPDALIVVARDGRIVLVNAQTERVFGYARAELLGQRLDRLVPEPPHAHGANLTSYLMGPEALVTGSVVELVARRKDGSELPIEASASTLATDDGPLIAWSIRDVTERKKLDDARARLAAIVDSSEDAIIGKTLDGVITSWNAGAERLFGYTAAEAIGQPISLIVPPGREEEEPRILGRLRGGERVELSDTVRRRKDGTDVHVSVCSSPVRDANGRVIRASKVARDITARRSAEEALRRAKDEAVMASRELEAFSYTIAHDLRAPLRGVNGFAELLLEAYKDRLDDEGRDWLEEIHLNARKMSTRIDALLALARLTRSELHRQDVDLSSMARQILAELAASDPARRVEVVVAPDLRVSADPVLLRSLLENLLGNAWKFTSKNDRARIEVGLRREGDAEAFFVADDGAGFDMAYAKHLFDPFHRLHGADEFPGTGIGLTTVQRIARRHGGAVWAEGSVARGATFYFVLRGK